MGDFKGQCFVMQPFDKGLYDNLYEQVFEPAISGAQLRPYRVDNDPSASIPIETIEEEITNSLACFGEVSENNPNVWFELGYAIARDKPLCLVSSDSREKFPFDVQHRRIIRYPAHSLPKDYEALKKAITERLIAVVEKEESRRQNTETANALADAPKTEGLAPHELLVLTLIFEEQFSDGLSPYMLNESMRKSGYTRPAANLAVTGLMRKNYVELRPVQDQDRQWDAFFVAEKGQDWLLANQQKLNLKIRTHSEIDPYAPAEITDDDIPF
jgi:hypothetical protein